MGRRIGRRAAGTSRLVLSAERWLDSSSDVWSPNSPEQSSTGQAAADLQAMNQSNVERNQVLEEEEDKTVISTVEKAPPALDPPRLAQLRNENADSFDIEEVRCSPDSLSSGPIRTVVVPI